LRLAALTLASLSLATHTLDPHHHGSHWRVVGHGQIRFDGLGPERWAQRARRAEAKVASLRSRLSKERRIILSSPTVTEAIDLAAATYGYGGTLWRKARCESGLNAWAHNSSGASGLFQFLTSTWRTTPYSNFSVFDPFANALAAGWMHSHGRGGEWSCR